MQKFDKPVKEYHKISEEFPGQKELAIPILSLNPTIKLNEEKPHKQRIMQKFDKPVKEYHKISEEFPAFHLFGKRGTLLH